GGTLNDRGHMWCRGGTVHTLDLPERIRDAAAAAGVAFDPPEAASATAAASTDPAQLSATTTLPPQGIDLRGHMAGIELELLRAALEQSNGVVAHAAPLLGLRRTTLVEKLRKYGIDRDQAVVPGAGVDRQAAGF